MLGRRSHLEGVLRMGIVAIQDILVAHLCTQAEFGAHEASFDAINAMARFAGR